MNVTVETPVEQLVTITMTLQEAKDIADSAGGMTPHVLRDVLSDKGYGNLDRRVKAHEGLYFALSNAGVVE